MLTTEEYKARQRISLEIISNLFLFVDKPFSLKYDSGIRLEIDKVAFLVLRVPPKLIPMF